MALMIFKATDAQQRAMAAAFLVCDVQELAHMPLPINIDYWNGEPTHVRFGHFTYGACLDEGEVYTVTGLMDGRILRAGEAAGAELLAIVSNETLMCSNRDWIEDSHPHLRGKLGDLSKYDQGKWWEHHPLLDAHGPWMQYYIATTAR